MELSYIVSLTDQDRQRHYFVSASPLAERDELRLLNFCYEESAYQIHAICTKRAGMLQYESSYWCALIPEEGDVSENITGEYRPRL